MAHALHLHPFRSPDEVKTMVDRLAGAGPLVHPAKVILSMRAERSTFQRFNGWLADHIVGLAGTMVFFYLLCVLMGTWAFWQSAIASNSGFDPYPFSFLFFILGGIMQSLFVPTMLTASNRATERDRIKDETDHRAWQHLYDVNDTQLEILNRMAAFLDAQGVAKAP